MNMNQMTTKTKTKKAGGKRPVRKLTRLEEQLKTIEDGCGFLKAILERMRPPRYGRVSVGGAYLYDSVRLLGEIELNLIMFRQSQGGVSA